MKPRIIWTGLAVSVVICAPAWGENAKLDAARWDDIRVDESASSSRDLTFSKTGEATRQVEEQGDPHQGSRTWLSAPPSDQLAREAQLQPVLTGGIFIPAMSDGIDEPKVQIRDDDDKIIREVRTGTTAYVPSGDYSVSVGSAGARERLEYQVHVVEGKVTQVPVEWSGLIVKVVNARASMIRADYEIVSLPDRSYIGLGTGALIHEGERLSTWLLWPGLYMIISAGEGYQARKNFITVRLEPGELSRVTLVLDEDTGDILGGGEIEGEVEEVREERWWWASAIVGGSVRFNRTDNVVGKVTGQLIDISAFFESYVTFDLNKHFLYARLNAEIGGQIRFEERPFTTSIDELNLELLYTYRVIDWFGPYARFSFESNMAPTWQEFSGAYTVNTYSKTGELVSSKENQNDVKLSPSFSPLKLNMGAGGRFDVTVGSWLKLASRIGLAYRYVYTDDLYIVTEHNDEENYVNLSPVLSSSQFGIEAALTLDLTPLQWLTIKTEFSLIEPFDAWDDPVIDLDFDAAIRLSSIASLSYSLRLNYDTSMIDKVQLDQYIHLRFSYKIY